MLFIPASDIGLIPLLGVSLILGFVLFSLQSLYQAAAAEYSPTDTRGLSYGYTLLGQFGFRAAGAAIVGFILTYSAMSIVFATVAAFALIAAAIVILLYRQ